MHNTTELVIKCLSKFFELTDKQKEAINGDTLIIDICEDSLGMFEAVMILEDEFDINIASPEKLHTVSDLVGLIEGQIANG